MLLLLLAALLLSACGGSSRSAAASANGGKPTNAAPAKPATRGGAPVGALRECLQKSGITLESRTGGQPGAPGASGGFRPGAGPRLPKGVTRSQFQAALKKCGGANLARGATRLKGAGAGGKGARRFARFAACMAGNGVKLPAPNTSGKGPIFNTTGLDTSSAKFKAADSKCMSELRPPGASAH